MSLSIIAKPDGGQGSESKRGLRKTTWHVFES
jgi:hypothetical protein